MTLTDGKFKGFMNWHIFYPLENEFDVKPKKQKIMALIKYNNRDYRPVSFSSLLDRFFNDSLMSDEFRGEDAQFIPQVDVAETDKAFEINFSVPGMNKEDFHIDLNDNTLTVSGERKFENEKKEKNYHTVESYYGSFRRAFHLPKEVREEKIEANYKDGILRIVVPKDETKAAKKLISIK